MRKSSLKSLPSLSLRIDLDEERINPGKIQLLENIRSCGSISTGGSGDEHVLQATRGRLWTRSIVTAGTQWSNHEKAANMGRRHTHAVWRLSGWELSKDRTLGRECSSEGPVVSIGLLTS
jgi:hypothetical protein